MKRLIRLVAFDLDGTLTRERSCLQAVCGAFGLTVEQAVLENAHSDDELARGRRLLWRRLKDRRPAEIADALARIPLAPGAATGIAALSAAGIRTVIVSLALAPNVAYFARRLGIDAYIATEPDDSDGFRHVFPATKPLLLAEHARGLGLDMADLAAVGDSSADLPMLCAAGTSLYVGRRLPDGFTPTWHLPDARIDDVAQAIINPPEDSRRESVEG
ncbi:HAD family hydrolase [Streptosporangium sp. CA-135522]|uniref:HAD family hydrolase n=1 Tax=Streptosporangium sp. CA-135522 TaxID=3240072 RepID=UPI003D943EC3